MTDNRSDCPTALTRRAAIGGTAALATAALITNPATTQAASVAAACASALATEGHIGATYNLSVRIGSRGASAQHC